MAQRYAHNGERSYGRHFYLVQRVYPSKRGKYAAMSKGKIDYNPFGYGRLGDYELDYMGSAEFEWGAIPDSLKRFAEANDNNKLMRGELDYKPTNKKLVFLYIEDDYPNGEELYDEFLEWVGERCDGKEPSYDFHERLTDPERYAENEKKGWTRNTEVWWSLLDDVMFSFVDEDGTSHLEKMLNSMGADSNQGIRGAR